VPQSLPGLWRSIPKWLLDPYGPVSVRAAYLPRFLPWAVRFLRNGRPAKVAAISVAMAALTRHNVDLYRRHLSGTGREHLLRDSFYLFAYRNPEAIDLRQAAFRLRQDQGAPLEVIDAATLQEIEPALSPDFKAAVLVKDQARALSPGDLGQTLADKARAGGAEILRASVLAIRPSDDGAWRLETSEGRIEAPVVVIAAGPWSLELLQPLGVNPPLESERGYHLEFTDPGVCLNHSVSDVERKFVTSSMVGGIRSAGTAEFAGLNAPPDFRRARILVPLTKAMLPDLNTDVTREWMGVRPSLPDSLPCIGAVPGQRNLFAAFGHSHYGLGMAPGTGELIGDLVAGRQPNIDISPYRISRFG
jgi:D-amino-acid dehydrogenase